MHEVFYVFRIFILCVYVLLNHLHSCNATIDINLPELEYIADHLEAEECRKLVASLHFDSYQMPNSIDSAERKISDDIPCIRLLIHWNSGKGEGVGQTHEVLEHRLRQINRLDLADWLGNTVFQELGDELETNLNSSFNDIINITSTTASVMGFDNLENENDDDVFSWLPLDSVCFVIILVLASITILVLLRVLWTFRPWCRRKNRDRPLIASNKYSLLDLDSEASISESEYEIYSAKQDNKSPKYSSQN